MFSRRSFSKLKSESRLLLWMTSNWESVVTSITAQVGKVSIKAHLSTSFKQCHPTINSIVFFRSPKTALGFTRISRRQGRRSSKPYSTKAHPQPSSSSRPSTSKEQHDPGTTISHENFITYHEVEGSNSFVANQEMALQPYREFSVTEERVPVLSNLYSSLRKYLRRS